MDAGTVETFRESGVVKLSSVFTPAQAEQMREVVWQDLFHSEGVVQEDRSTWRRRTPRSKLARAKRHPVFDALLGGQLGELADALLGPDWSTSAAYGNLLVDFPDADRWHLPGRDGFWHCDFGNYPALDPLPALRVFAVFGDVPPGGGATLLVAGSGRMLVRYMARNPGTPTSLKAEVPWHREIPYLRDLTLTEVPSDPGEAEARRRRFMDTVTDVEGIPARVVEACGQPGDAYVCHPWTIHTKAPNASDQPRFLRAPTLLRGSS